MDTAAFWRTEFDKVSVSGNVCSACSVMYDVCGCIVVVVIWEINVFLRREGRSFWFSNVSEVLRSLFGAIQRL